MARRRAKLGRDGHRALVVHQHVRTNGKSSCRLDEAAFPLDDAVRTALLGAVDALRQGDVAVNESARPTFKLIDAFHTYTRLLWPLMYAGVPDNAFEEYIAAAGKFSADDHSLSAQFYRVAIARRWRSSFRTTTCC